MSTTKPTAAALRAAEDVCKTWWVSGSPKCDADGIASVASVIDQATGLPGLLARQTAFEAMREALRAIAGNKALYDVRHRYIRAGSDWWDKMPDAWPLHLTVTMGEFRALVKALDLADEAAKGQA